MRCAQCRDHAHTYPLKKMPCQRLSRPISPAHWKASLATMTAMISLRMAAATMVPETMSARKGPMPLRVLTGYLHNLAARAGRIWEGAFAARS